jgi:general secretion pathway protein L
MLREYYDWWVGQMLAFAPDRLRRSLIDAPQALLVEPDPASGGQVMLTLSTRRHDQTGRLGRFPLDAEALAPTLDGFDPNGPVWLVLPSDLLLEKRLTLPSAAQRDLDRVLGFELDRETPFSADEAWWDHAIEERDRQQGTITVRLSLVPRAAIAPLIAGLQAAGITPSGLEVAAADGTMRQITIDATRHSGAAWHERSVRLAAIACAALLVLAIAMPFARQVWTKMDLDAQMAALKPKVDEAEKLRRQLDGAGGSDVLSADRARLGDPMRVLSAATTLLPNDTYLTDFTMSQRRLTLNGQSVGPAKLIGAFAADPTFKDPAFAAPSTHIEGAKTETFSISAEARP